MVNAFKTTNPVDRVWANILKMPAKPVVNSFPLYPDTVFHKINPEFAFRFVKLTIPFGLTTRDARSSSDKNYSGYDNQIVGRFVYQCVPAMSTVNRWNVACVCRPRRNAHRHRTTMTGHFGIEPSWFMLLCVLLRQLRSQTKIAGSTTSNIPKIHRFNIVFF